MTRLPLSVLCASAVSPCFAQQLAFTDATQQAGLAGISAARLCIADLDGDTRPDVIIRAITPGELDRYRVFLNEPGQGGAGFSLREVEHHNLPVPRAGDCLVIADLDNDGTRDALFVRSLDINADTYAPPPAPERTCWFRGNGDGTFGEPVIIEAAAPATSACVAVGDLDLDGALDIVIGNWYTKYGHSNEAFPNTYLRGRIDGGRLTYESLDLGIEQPGFDEETDTGGRPTYGIAIAHLSGDRPPDIIELNYGRRWNRLIAPHDDGGPFAVFRDIAPETGFDGDDIRHGRYPAWLKERAKTDPRFDRADEKPFRSNGNTFDCAIGDIDNDGDFDIFLAEITHGWAGDSSDRSRFLVNQLERRDGSPRGHFASPPHLAVDRLPPDPTILNWNQGDLFAELADFDHDTRLDLLLSSGDYPDTQRLRLFRQQEDGSFRDITDWCGLNNEGSAQIALGDLDLDGDIDILVGQTFNRLSTAQIAGRTPTVKLYLNQTVERRAQQGRGPGSVTLILKGDPSRGVNADAINALIRARIDHDNLAETPPIAIHRQLLGPGGHAGKQCELLIHIPLGDAAAISELTITWPGNIQPTTLTRIPPGRHVVDLAEPP